MRISNLSDGPTKVGGVSIPPGQTRNVANWNEVKDSERVQRMLSERTIAPEYEQKPEPDPEPDEKDRLIADLAELGVHKTRRNSVETLQEALEEATE